MKISNSALALLLVAGLIGGCASNQAKEEAKPESAAAADTKGASDSAAPATSNDTYNVVRGDNLWNISGKPVIYGNPYEWPLIFKANRDKIRDADLIEPGQVLAINRNASGADVNAAVAHAKARGAWQLGVTEQSDLAYLSKYGMK